MKYRVKNFILRDSKTLQIIFRDWLESREHITVVSTNIWTDTVNMYATIVYMEDNYAG